MRTFSGMDPDDVLKRRAQRGERRVRAAGGEPRAADALIARGARARLARGCGRRGAGGPRPRAWLALPKFRGDARFDVALHRIVVNAAHDVRAKRREQIARRAARPGRPRDRFAEQFGELQRALNGLDESYRVAVVLRRARLLLPGDRRDDGVPEGTVKSRIFRGRTELAERRGTTMVNGVERLMAEKSDELERFTVEEELDGDARQAVAEHLVACRRARIRSGGSQGDAPGRAHARARAIAARTSSPVPDRPDPWRLFRPAKRALGRGARRRGHSVRGRVRPRRDAARQQR